MSQNNIGKFSFASAYLNDHSCPKGTTYFDRGRWYVFAYNFGADSWAAGDVVCLSTTFVYGNCSNTAATIMDVTDGTTIRPVVAGVAGATIATTQYGWLWFRGYG